MEAPALHPAILDLADLTLDPRNARTHDEANLASIKASLKAFGQRKPIVVRREGLVVEAGNGTVEAARALGWTTIVAVLVDDDEATAVAYAIADNRTAELAAWDFGTLGELMSEFPKVDWSGLGWDAAALEQIEWPEVPGETTTVSEHERELPGDGEAPTGEPGEPAPRRMVDTFGAPPFTVLNARLGYWQERKRQWLALGIQSEIGRGGKLAYAQGGNDDPVSTIMRHGGAMGGTQGQALLRNAVPGGAMFPSATINPTTGKFDRADLHAKRPGKAHGRVSGSTERQGYGAGYDLSQGESAWGGSGTSIFDPVLTELLVRWFSPADGHVLDPFAGGSVRGIVTAKLGRRYTGIELRPEQVAANLEQAEAILGGEGAASWICGDSNVEIEALEPEYDMILSCPPYFDLEVYSDRKDDISAFATYKEFLAVYRSIIAKAVARLRPDSFAAWVVGDLRDKKGFLRGFVSDTISAFEDAGARLYNEAILVTAVGSLPVRAVRAMQATRKLGKTHQNVLVFYRGDPRKIRERCGEVTGVDRVEAEVPDRFVDEPTPLEQRGGFWLKRDDLYTIAGVPGGKVRTCWSLARGAKGLITAGSRQSPQVNIVAHIARRLGVPCRVHVPSGNLTPELESASAAGAELVQHRPGYNTVIVARARADAEQHADQGWIEIPFGMECQEAVRQTAAQVPERLPEGVRRIVVPVGSGMSLAGVLAGLAERGHDVPVLGVQVGADPSKRLDTYAPGWRDRATLAQSSLDYHDHAPVTVLEGVELDPVYEAKCIPFVEPGDLLWVVGIRASSAHQVGTNEP